jgi:predicted deacylase
MRSVDIREFDPRAVAPGAKEALYLEVTHTPAGMPIRHTALTIGGVRSGPVLVVSGGVHGDEFEGPLTVMRLFQELQPADIAGTFVGLTVANVPAFEAATRNSPIDGLNLARTFPGDPKGSVTQQIAYWMGERLIGRADFYADLHSSGSDSEMPTLCGYNMGSGPAAELRKRAAEVFHAPVTWAHPTQAPGRTLSYALDHNIPAIYTECPASRCVSLDDVAIYQRGMRNVMRLLGMLAGPLEGERSQYYLCGAGDTDDAIAATVGGFFIPERKLLEWVQAGDVLGKTYDLAGNVLETLRAPSAGYVVMRQLLPTVHAGSIVFMISDKYQGEWSP